MPGAGVEGGEEVGRTGPLILVFNLDGAAWLSRSGGNAAGTRLERGHLVEAEDHLVIGQEAGEQLADRSDVCGERGVARTLMIENRPGHSPLSGV